MRLDCIWVTVASEGKNIPNCTLGGQFHDVDVSEFPHTPEVAREKEFLLAPALFLALCTSLHPRLEFLHETSLLLVRNPGLGEGGISRRGIGQMLQKTLQIISIEVHDDMVMETSSGRSQLPRRELDVFASVPEELMNGGEA